MRNRMKEYFAELEAKCKPMIARVMYQCGSMSLTNVRTLMDGLALAREQLSYGDVHGVALVENGENVVVLTPYH